VKIIERNYRLIIFQTKEINDRNKRVKENCITQGLLNSVVKDGKAILEDQ